jgi:protein-S-isoprenylcysteine O-methyltransferase Ste14
MLSVSKTKPSANRQLISPVLTGICLTLMLLLHWLYPIGLLIHFPFSLTGLLLSGLGLTISFAAHQQFKKIGTTLYPFSQPERLVTEGLFRYTRNPMYLGLTIFLAGVWFFLGSLLPGVFVAVFLLIADRWYIAYEEQQLLAIFGATYAAYQVKTPCWIWFRRKKNGISSPLSASHGDPIYHLEYQPLQGLLGVCGCLPAGRSWKD